MLGRSQDHVKREDACAREMARRVFLTLIESMRALRAWASARARVCVRECVCVREREREREKRNDAPRLFNGFFETRHRDTHVVPYILIRTVCVLITFHFLPPCPPPSPVPLPASLPAPFSGLELTSHVYHSTCHEILPRPRKSL